jgi:hypothetical protein
MGSIATKNEEAALMECYRRLYKASTPSADFDKLVENAKLNERGQKVIPFNDYELEQADLDRIINEVMREYKIRKYRRQAFTATIYLGCSPRTKN